MCLPGVCVDFFYAIGYMCSYHSYAFHCRTIAWPWSTSYVPLTTKGISPCFTPLHACWGCRIVICDSGGDLQYHAIPYGHFSRFCLMFSLVLRLMQRLHSRFKPRDERFVCDGCPGGGATDGGAVRWRLH